MIRRRRPLAVQRDFEAESRDLLLQVALDLRRLRSDHAAMAALLSQVLRDRRETP
jgi:hypothetical protein